MVASLVSTIVQRVRSSKKDLGDSIWPPSSSSSRDCSQLRFTYSPGEYTSWLRTWYTCKDSNDFDSCEGYIIEVARFIGDFLKMNVSMINPPQLSPSEYLQSNDTWSTGRTKDVIDGKADFSFSGVSAADRCRFVECMDYTMEEFFRIFMPTPLAKPFTKAILQPFSLHTWVTFLFAALSVGFFMSFFKKSHYQEFAWLTFFGTVLGQDVTIRHNARGNQGTDRSNGAITTASHDENGTTNGQRTIFPWATWFVAMLFITSCYTALIFDFFMDPYEKRFSNLGQVVNSKLDIVLSSELGTNLPIIKRSKHPTLAKMVAKMRLTGREEAFSFYPGPNEALIIQESILSLRIEKFKESGDSRWMTSYMITQREPLPIFYQGPFFRKDFCKMKEAKAASKALVENGFNIGLEKKFFGEIKLGLLMNGKEPNRDHSPLGLSNVYGLFIYLMIGSGLATLTFIGEVCAGYYHGKYG